MRFERINLVRYGCFTGHTIVFGPAAAEGDLHIVYGPNEAGKSTLRDACMDFLYGFPNKSPYNFLHANDLLEIGALLRAGGVEYEGRRIKRATDTFIGQDGAPRSDAALRARLGDISREGFEQMFSLNDVSLEAGGEGILRSEGDLGALLFQAASGLSSLSAGLEAAQAQAEGFFKKSGRKLRLNTLIDELQEVEGRLKDIDIAAGTYEKLKEADASASARHAEAKALRDDHVRRAEALKHLLEAAEHWKHLQALELALEPLSDAPNAPEGLLDESQRLVAAQASAQRALQESGQAFDRARKAQDVIQVDDAALVIAEAIKRASGDLEARYRTSDDIDNRRRELRGVEMEVAALLEQLGRPAVEDPQALILPIARVGEIRDLMERRGELVAAENTAREELEVAEERRDAAEEGVDAVGESPDRLALARAVVAARDEADERVVVQAARQCERLLEELTADIAGLALWRGDAIALAALKIPVPEDVRRRMDEGRAIKAERGRLEDEAERLADLQAERTVVIQSLLEDAGVVDDAHAGGARETRDAAWSEHRDGLEANPQARTEILRASARAFETAMIEDDKIGATRLARAAQLADLRQARAAQAKDERGLARVREKVEDLSRREEQHLKAVAALFSSLGLPPEGEIEALPRWIASVESAKSKAVTLSEAERELRAVQSQFDTATAAIELVMAEAGLARQGLAWKAKLALCDEEIERWRAAERSREAAASALRDAFKEHARREKTHKRAREALATWSDDWTAAVGATWIGTAPPAAIREILPALDRLTKKLEEASKLSARIEAMTRDRATYRSEIARLAAAVDEPCATDDPLNTADRLRARAAQAEEAARIRKARAEDFNAAQERHLAAEDEARSIAERVDELRALIAADDLEGVIAQLQRAKEKRDLVAQTVRVESSLRRVLGVSAVVDARAKLKEQASSPEAIATLADELGDLERSRAIEDDHVTELHHEWRKAEGALDAVGADDEAARLEERRRTLLLGVEEEAHAFMRLSAGVMLVNEALRAYRETHRSSMMEKASEAFVRITRGAFRSLTAAPSKNGEVLVGVRADGSSIIASQMSRGTRFQLYLALRVAGYAEFANHRETLPFFADDVLEPFDDDRSKETFALLHEMSKAGQVVYLTHHRHLCDIARSVCGESVRVHELPDRSPRVVKRIG